MPTQIRIQPVAAMALRRIRPALAAVALVAVTLPAGAQEPGGAQIAAKPDTGRPSAAAELPDQLDLSFDARAFAAEGADGGSTATHDRAARPGTEFQERSSQVRFDGIHRMTIDLYPDDRRPADNP